MDWVRILYISIKLDRQEDHSSQMNLDKKTDLTHSWLGNTVRDILFVIRGY